MSKIVYKRSMTIYLSKNGSDGTVSEFHDDGLESFTHDGITYDSWSALDLQTKSYSEFTERLNAFKLYIYSKYNESNPDVYDNIDWGEARISVIVEDPVISEFSQSSLYIDSFNLNAYCPSDNIIEYGFILSSIDIPTISSNEIKVTTSYLNKNFGYAITGLNSNTVYNCVAYVLDNTSEVYYSANLQVTTLSVDVNLTTDSTFVSGNQCTVYCTMTTEAPVDTRGVLYGTDPTLDTFTPMYINNLSSPNYGVATYILTGLSSSTTYYVRAYASNIDGEYFGNILSFNIV